MALFKRARKLKSTHGNFDQWGDGYPFPDFVADWVRRGEMYVVTRDGDIVGTFAAFTKYAEYDGADLGWLNEDPYICIGAFALESVDELGIIKNIIKWCAERTDNIRVDTGVKNFAAQYMLKKHGFEHVGTFIPTYENATEMIAFHLVL